MGRRVITVTLAAAWCLVAFAIAGTSGITAAVRSIIGGGAAPTARTVATLIVWLAAAVFVTLAAVDVGTWFARRRTRVTVRVPFIVLALGAVLLITGVVAQVDSYRVCCAPPPTTVSR